MNPVQEFVWEHREDDPSQLALSAAKYPAFSMGYVARQVDALRRIRHKAPFLYRPGVVFPSGLSVEQSSSEGAARFKASLFSGEMMVDLTGGLGVDAYWFSKRFSTFHYVEQQTEIQEAVRNNFSLLGVSNVAFHENTAEKFLAETDQHFDLIYLDPARRDERKGKVFNFADCTPNLLEIKDILLEKSPKILVKTAPLLDLMLACRQLGNQVSKIWVLEYEGECREVLYLMERENLEPDRIPICAVSVGGEGEVLSEMAFNWREELDAKPEYALPDAYLYEPGPSVMKSGGFKVFAERFGLKKLHANTHLYTSAEWRKGVPGRSFKVMQVCRYDKKEVANFIPDGKANVSVRNFPDNAEQVRVRLKLSGGGDVYVFAATDVSENLVILICRKA